MWTKFRMRATFGCISAITALLGFAKVNAAPIQFSNPPPQDVTWRIAQAGSSGGDAATGRQNTQSRSNAYHFIYKDEANYPWGNNKDRNIAIAWHTNVAAGQNAAEAWGSIRYRRYSRYMQVIPCENASGWTAHVALFDGLPLTGQAKYGIGFACGENTHDGALVLAWRRAQTGLSKEGGRPVAFIVMVGRLSSVKDGLDDLTQIYLPDATDCRSATLNTPPLPAQAELIPARLGSTKLVGFNGKPADYENEYCLTWMGRSR